uniref:Polymeric immunoglobulin receptor-like n=1 Tax=Sparus aurata TaxID=8175 RepID=A0A671TGA1_SPAAU
MFVLQMLTRICVTRAAGLIRVYGYEGREVDVPCPYGGGYESYVKYLCKNDCADKDVVVKTDRAEKSKYSIRDNRTSRVFTATVSQLSRADAGKYWCSVMLFILLADTCCDQSIKVEDHEEATVSFDCPYESGDQNNQKYFCRGNLRSTCLQQALFTSTSQQSGRFRLQDDTRVKAFKATIINLTQADSGQYLCGVHRDTVTVKVELKMPKKVLKMDNSRRFIRCAKTLNSFCFNRVVLCEVKQTERHRGTSTNYAVSLSTTTREAQEVPLQAMLGHTGVGQTYSGDPETTPRFNYQSVRFENNRKKEKN